jgi:hypothetical protein
MDSEAFRDVPGMDVLDPHNGISIQIFDSNLRLWQARPDFFGDFEGLCWNMFGHSSEEVIEGGFAPRSQRLGIDSTRPAHNPGNDRGKLLTFNEYVN